MSNPDPDQSELIKRIADLEMRAVHQDKTIDDLNEMVAKQWQTIDQINQQFTRLKDRLGEMETFGSATKLEDEPPPPHY